MLRFLFILLVKMLVLIGCSQDDPESKEFLITPSPDQPHLSLALSDSVFQQDSLYVIKIQVDSADWEFLNEDPGREEYVPAKASLMGLEFDHVGLRYKGAGGTLFRCLDEDKVNSNCDKLSLKIHFSKYQKKQRLMGLKKINLHAMDQDLTKVQEQLAYSVYRGMGLAAPRASWAKVILNDVDMGIYGLVEQIDGRFTKWNWPKSGDGNLYKEKYPSVDNEEYYIQGQKTNEENPSGEAMLNLNQAISTADHYGALDGLLNMDAWVRHLGIDWAINNSDGITTFYCQGRPFCESHNFYFYENLGEMIPIVWDLNQAFSSREAWPGLTQWNVTPENCEPRKYYQETIHVKPANCDPLMAYTAKFYRDDYRDVLIELNDKFFDGGLLIKSLEHARLLIQGSGHQEDLDQWLFYLDKLRESIGLLQAKLLREVERLKD